MHKQWTSGRRTYLVWLAVVLLMSSLARFPDCVAQTASPPLPLAPSTSLLQNDVQASMPMLAQSGGETRAVAVYGSLALVGVGPRVLVVRISDPVRPVVIGQSEPLAGVVTGIGMWEGYALVSCFRAGLSVLDLVDPTGPVVVGSWATPGTAEGLAVTAGRAYVADGNSGLRILSVADPQRPNELGSAALPRWVQNVAVEGDVAYVANGQAGLSSSGCGRSEPGQRDWECTESLLEDTPVTWLWTRE